MKITAAESIPSIPMDMPGAEGVQMRVLIGENEGAPHFVMRQFEVVPGGSTPHHHHNYEHEIFILDGEGTVLEGDTPKPFTAGDTIYVPANEPHQFRNTGDRPLKFLCLIPKIEVCKA